MEVRGVSSLQLASALGGLAWRGKGKQLDHCHMVLSRWKAIIRHTCAMQGRGPPQPSQ